MKALLAVSLRLCIFLAVVAQPTLWAQRVSPDDGFFSAETPQSWKVTNYGNILSWDSPDDHASILASSVEGGHLIHAEATSFFEDKGFKLTGSDVGKIIGPWEASWC